MPRGILSVASQFANTGTNLVLAILVARNSTPAELGVWGIAYALIVIGLNVNRSISSTPVLIGLDEGREDLREGASGSSFIVGTVLATMFALLAAIFEQEAALLIAFAISCPILLVQDNLRYELFKIKRYGTALGIDLLWLGVQCCLAAALAVVGLSDYISMTLAWAAGALVSLIFGLAVKKALPSIANGFRFIISFRREGVQLLLDSLLGSASVNSIAPVVGLSVGVAAAGHFRAGLTILGGYGLFVSAAVPLMTLRASNSIRRGEGSQRALRLWVLVFSAIASVYGSLLLLLPDSIGKFVSGESWSGLAIILLPLSLQLLARPLYTGVPIMLRAEREFGLLVKLRITTSLVNPLAVLIGGLGYGIVGAAYGWFIGTCFCSIVYYMVYRWAVTGK